MAKVQQKSEKITAFGGIFFVLDKFDSILSSVIDSHLGLRSTLIGYQYSEIIRAVFSVFCCGGDCMEDLNLYLKEVLTERPHTCVPSHYRHGGKFLPIHRGIAAYGRPLWYQGHRQGQEFPVQIHRRACQVDQNGKTIQTQHLGGSWGQRHMTLKYKGASCNLTYPKLLPDFVNDSPMLMLIYLCQCWREI